MSKSFQRCLCNLALSLQGSPSVPPVRCVEGRGGFVLSLAAPLAAASGVRRAVGMCNGGKGIAV